MKVYRPALRTRGFTLIELLVMIAILLGMLLPALSNAKAKVKQAAYRNHFWQLMLSFQMYGDDFDGQIQPRISSEPSWKTV